MLYKEIMTYTVQRHEHCVGDGAGTAVLAGEMLEPALRWLLIYASDCCYVPLATSNSNCIPSALCVCQSPADRYGCVQLLSLWRCDVSTFHFSSWTEYHMARRVTWDCHSGGAEGSVLLGCDTVSFGQKLPTFQKPTIARNVGKLRAEQHDVTLQENWILWRYNLETNPQYEDW